jgi:6-pyruvoyltetrahydropterin/6-carboxytetrahydropterin synthase
MNVGTEVEIAIAHRLMDYEGKCASLHGHNYRIVVEGRHATADPYYPGKGMELDFKDLKRALMDILEPFDHATMLRKDDPLQGAIHEDVQCKLLLFPWNPTAENFALFIQKQLLLTDPFLAWKVRVYETSKSYAEV